MNKYKAAVVSILIACGLSFAACSEDGENENDKPDIYTQVETFYNDINGTTKCSDIYNKAVKYTNDNVNLTNACEDYNESLTGKASGNVDRLIRNFDNSGYYLAMFILLDRLTEQVHSCSADRDGKTTTETSKAWQELFEKNGCSGILDKADEIAKDRGM